MAAADGARLLAFPAFFEQHHASTACPRVRPAVAAGGCFPEMKRDDGRDGGGQSANARGIIKFCLEVAADTKIRGFHRRIWERRGTRRVRSDVSRSSSDSPTPIEFLLKMLSTR